MEHETSLDVQIWAIDKYTGKRKNTYWVVWFVAKQRFKEKFSASALAEAFRSQLVTAASKGERFRLADGRPLSMALQNQSDTTWYKFICDYVDRKWSDA